MKIRLDHRSRRETLMLLGAAGINLVGCGTDGEPAEGSKGSGEAGAGAGGKSAGDGGAGGRIDGGGPSGSDEGGAGMKTAGGEPAVGGSGAEGGEGGQVSSAGQAGAGGAGPQCVVRPSQTIGPFPNKAELDRSDVRGGQPGTPLRLALRVLSASTCAPVAGAIVDIWQCNAAGDYSEYSAFGTADQNWLRGFQTTDDEGAVTFLTIYPGWYPGRSVHIHFRVRAGAQTFVSQLYFDDAVSDVALAEAPYTEHAGVRTLNSGDGIFSSGGAELTLEVVKQGAEYVSSFDVGLAMG
jgi:protocatechuate 3,4-dioxygenase beta subunit